MTQPLTPAEHEHSAAIDEAAHFLANTPPKDRPRPLVPALKAMFGLSALEAVQAMHQANLRLARAK